MNTSAVISVPPTPFPLHCRCLLSYGRNSDMRKHYVGAKVFQSILVTIGSLRYLSLISNANFPCSFKSFPVLAWFICSPTNFPVRLLHCEPHSRNLQWNLLYRSGILFLVVAINTSVLVNQSLHHESSALRQVVMEIVRRMARVF